MALFSAIGAAIGAVGTFIGGLGTIGSFLLQTAVGVGLNLLAQAIAGKPSRQNTAASFGINGTLQAGGDVPRSFILGQYATAGSLVWVNTWGQDGETPNAFLTQVIAIADLPGHTLSGVFVNGERVTFGESPHPDYGYPVNEYRKGGSNHLWIKWYDGTQTAADSFLVSKASNANRQWESTRVGRGVTYVIATARIAQNMFSGIPNFKFEVSGIKLYDPSKDSTVPGGSGSHRWNNPATWGGDGDHYPAVQIYNLLRGIEFEGQWFYGLQGVTGARLPTADWIRQINKCRAGNTYRAGGEITVDVPLAPAVEAFLTACQGRLSEFGGVYNIHVGEPDEPVASFSDGDILSTEEQSFTPFFGLADTINGIAATYPSPADAWSEKAAPPLYRTDLEVLAGNRRLMADVSLNFVPYPEQVQRLMRSALAEGQRARRHTLVLPPKYWPYAVPGEVLSWTSVRNGYVDKWFRIDGAVDRANLDVMVDITEVDPSDYDWDSGTDFRPPVDGALGTLRPPPQPLAGWQVFPATIGQAGNQLPSIRVAYPGALADVRSVRVLVRLAGETAPFFDGEIPYGDPETNENPSSVTLAGTFAPNTDHEVRGKLEPFGVRETEWSEWLPVRTPDVWVSDPGAALALYLVTAQANAQGSVNERWEKLNDKIIQIAQAVAAAQLESVATGASVRRQEITFQTATESLAQEITEVRAQVEDDVASAISVLEASVFDPDDGLPSKASASALTALSVTVGENTNDIAELMGVDSEGNSYWTIVAKNNGVVGAFVDLATGNQQSNIVLGAGAISAVNPDPTLNGGNPLVLWSTETVTIDGVPRARMVLNGEMIADAIKAGRVEVISLDAITANVGIMRAGRLIDPDNTSYFDLEDQEWARFDGKASLSLKTRRILFLGD